MVQQNGCSQKQECVAFPRWQSDPTPLRRHGESLSPRALSESLGKSFGTHTSYCNFVSRFQESGFTTTDAHKFQKLGCTNFESLNVNSHMFKVQRAVCKSTTLVTHSRDAEIFFLSISHQLEFPQVAHQHHGVKTTQLTRGNICSFLPGYSGLIANPVLHPQFKQQWACQPWYIVHTCFFFPTVSQTKVRNTVATLMPQK